jgi:hypothetical protein
LSRAAHIQAGDDMNDFSHVLEKIIFIPMLKYNKVP